MEHYRTGALARVHQRLRALLWLLREALVQRFLQRPDEVTCLPGCERRPPAPSALCNSNAELNLAWCLNSAEICDYDWTVAAADDHSRFHASPYMSGSLVPPEKLADSNPYVYLGNREM